MSMDRAIHRPPPFWMAAGRLRVEEDEKVVRVVQYRSPWPLVGWVSICSAALIFVGISLHAPTVGLALFALIWLLTVMASMGLTTWWNGQPPVISFDRVERVFSVVRHHVSVPADRAWFILEESRCSDGEGGSYQIIAWVLNADSLASGIDLYAGQRKKHIREAAAEFMKRTSSLGGRQLDQSALID